MVREQLSLFSEAELAKMISPAYLRKKNHVEWELRKARLGAIWADLSKTLFLSDEGCPTIKPYYGVPESPLIDFKEARQIWYPNMHITHLRTITK